MRQLTRRTQARVIAENALDQRAAAARQAHNENRTLSLRVRLRGGTAGMGPAGISLDDPVGRCDVGGDVVLEMLASQSRSVREVFEGAGVLADILVLLRQGVTQRHLTAPIHST